MNLAALRAEDDLNQARKKIHRLLQTDAGKQALRDVTGLNILWQVDAEKERQSLPIVHVISPSYRSRVGQAWGATERMLQAARGVCRPVIEPRIDSSVVHWCRNGHLSALVRQKKDFDYVAFVDDDMAPPEDALIRLLAHGKDFVAAGCTVRVDPILPNFRRYNPENKVFSTCIDYEPNTLIGGLDYGVGAGLILMSFKAVATVAQYYINCEYEKKYYGLSGEPLDKLQNERHAESQKTSDFWWFEFLKHPFGRGEYSEDLSLCFKLIESGIPIFIDTSIKPKHIGEYGFSLDDYESERAAIIQNLIHEESQNSLLGMPEMPEQNPFLGMPMQETA